VSLEGWGDALGVLVAVLFFVGLPAYALGVQRGFERGRRHESDVRARERDDYANYEAHRHEHPEEAAEADRRLREAWRPDRDSGKG
jgi:hypothetical protein